MVEKRGECLLSVPRVTELKIVLIEKRHIIESLEPTCCFVFVSLTNEPSKYKFNWYSFRLYISANRLINLAAKFANRTHGLFEKRHF